jgi:hypothetical protein
VETQRTSDYLVNLVHGPEAKLHPTLTIGSLMHSMGGKAYGLLFIVLGLPNILPIPGLPILCGLVLLFIGVQLAIRAPSPWLPRALSEREISRASLASVIKRLFTWVVRLENISKPRFSLMASDEILRLIGIIVALLAISLIIIPIPWVGSMPQGLAISILGIGMVERDGIVISIGFVLAAIASLTITAIGFALIKSYGLLF